MENIAILHLCVMAEKTLCNFVTAQLKMCHSVQ